MTRAKQFLRRSLETGLGADRADTALDLARHARTGFAELDSWARYRLLSDGRQSIADLADLRNRYRGKRCVIIGNGPSLRDMDLSTLRDEFTFGLNRAYLMFDRIGFATTFLVAVNLHVIEQCADEIAGAGSRTFLSWHGRPYASAGSHPTYVLRKLHPGFYRDVRKGVWEGATVTYVALQLAYHMGFADVVLIGVDHSFATAGAPHQLIVSAGDDPDHFDPSYFGKGFRWQLPDLPTSEIAYDLARRAYEADGRRVVDATVGGKLEIFPKARYDELFGPTIGSSGIATR